MRSGTKILLISLGLFLGVWLLNRCILPLILPFLLGTGLALGAEPSVSLLCRKLHFPRGLGTGIGVTGTFLLVSLLLLSLAALVLRQLKSLAGILPDLNTTLVSGISLLESWLLRLADLVPPGIRPLLRQNLRELFSGGTAFLQKGAEFLFSLAGGFLTRIPDGALTLGTTLISGFMVSSRLPRLKLWVKSQMSRDSMEPVLRVLRRVKKTLGSWILAQLKLAGVTWLILTAGLILLAVPYAPLWALAIALMDALPVLGTGAVLIPWCLISLLSGSRVRALGLLGTYITVSLTRTVLEPKLVGHQLGLDPLVTLGALYAGYRLWGFPGMILSPLLCVTALQLMPKPGDSGQLGA